MRKFMAALAGAVAITVLASTPAWATHPDYSVTPVCRDGVTVAEVRAINPAVNGVEALSGNTYFAFDETFGAVPVGGSVLLQHTVGVGSHSLGIQMTFANGATHAEVFTFTVAPIPGCDVPSSVATSTTSTTLPPSEVVAPTTTTTQATVVKPYPAPSTPVTARPHVTGDVSETAATLPRTDGYDWSPRHNGWTRFGIIFIVIGIFMVIIVFIPKERNENDQDI